MTRSSQLVVALLATLICSAVTLPVPQQSEGENALEAKEALVKSLETDILKASVAAAAARAVRNEQKFEEDILKAAVETLKADQGNPEKRARDLRALRELVQRDKRQVDLLAGALGGGGEVRAEASADAGGSGSSSILQLLPSILGSSSGGGGGDSSDGGGSDSGSILQLLPSILGGLSSGGNGDSSDGEGGSDSGSILQLLPSLLGGLSSGGGDGDSSGGSNVLSLITGVLGASSGGGDSSSGGSSGGSGGGSGGFLGSLLTSKLAPAGPTTPPRPGTYDDLIGKGIQGYDPVLAFSNNLGPALRTKFTIFNSLFNLLSGVFSSSGGGKSASLSLSAST